MCTKSKTLSFGNQELFIGIDVHKKSWNVTTRLEKLELKTMSMNPSPEELKRHLESHYPGGNYHSVYEAGFCGFWIHRRLVELGIDNIIVSPTSIPTSAKERVRKTDEVDSRKLARELAAGSLKKIYVPEILWQELRGLSRQRYQFTRKLTRVKNQIKSYLSYYGIELPENCEITHWSANFIARLKSVEFTYEIGKEQLDNYLEELMELRRWKLKTLQSLRNYMRKYNQTKKMELLLKVPGVGSISAITLLTELIDINRFHNTDSLASYVGLAPSERSSGEKKNVLGLSVQSNRYLRQLMIEAAWIAAREDPALTLCFNKYSQKMCKQKAIVKIARKLLNRIYSVLKYERKYAYSVIE